MNSYDWLMGNLQAALRSERPLMKQRIRRGKIINIYESIKDITNKRLQEN